MPLFYRGAAVDTYWHIHDPRGTGFTPQKPGMSPSLDRLMEHIANGTVTSPFVSLTRSYSVAVDYALVGPVSASKANPAFVWESSWPSRYLQSSFWWIPSSASDRDFPSRPTPFRINTTGAKTRCWA